MRKALSRLTMIGVILLAFTSAALSANSLESGVVTWASTDSPIDVTGTKWANTDTWLSWDIEQAGTKDGFILWSYSYHWHTRTQGQGLQGLSHLILQVSPNAPLAEFQNFSWTLTSGDPQTYAPASNQSNPYLPGPIYGFKVSGSGVYELYLSFESTHGPMWGDFYAKGNNDNVAWNAGFGTTPSGDFSKWIAVPDTRQTHVPVPGAVWLLGPGLIGLVGIRRRFKK